MTSFMPPTPTRPRRAGIDALLQPATPSRPSDSSAHYDLAQPWDPTTAMPMPSTPATPNQPLLSLPYDYPPQSNPASADPYHELHFSGWPQALPPPDVLEHLVGLFFKHSSASPIFHGARYRAALANFPSHRSSQLDLAVLHAMIACATPFSTEMFRSAAPENECDPSERGKGKAKASSRSPASQAVAFATFHAERAAEIIEGFRRQYGSTYKLLASSIVSPPWAFCCLILQLYLTAYMRPPQRALSWERSCCPSITRSAARSRRSGWRHRGQVSGRCNSRGLALELRIECVSSAIAPFGSEHQSPTRSQSPPSGIWP